MNIEDYDRMTFLLSERNVNGSTYCFI